MESPTTPRAIEKIRAAFADKQWEITVPEWGGLTIYFRPLTQGDLVAAETNRQIGPELSAFEKNVNLLIRKARNADGSPMFAAGDAHALMTESRAEVLQRVVNFMYACGSLSIKEAEEELGNAPSSATTLSSPQSSA